MSSSSEKRVVIIGAGIGGLAAAIALKQKLGYDNFTIYEKAHDVGGTWRENVYPGCACDVPSHWYSLSTDWNPSWSKQYSSQPEILDYLRDVAKRRDLVKKIVFGAKLVSGIWDDSRKQYTIQLERYNQDGKLTGTETVAAHVVISAMGGLHVPAFPAIPGLDTFKGQMWHAAQWRYEVPLAGKRVGIIGNGCSAAQIVPKISDDPSVKVVNFCRTPSWFMPRMNYNLTRLSWVFKYVPFVAALYRFWIYVTSDIRYLVWTKHGRWARKNFAERVATKYIKATAPAHLHEKLIPKYEFGCKRVIVDPGYLASLNRPNVETEWDPIESIQENDIKMKSGKVHEVDIIVPCTGFDLANSAPPFVGTMGSVAQYFKGVGGPTAYRGTTIPSFPNLFVILGPNVASGHGSAIFVMEVQINYAMQLIKPILAGKLDAVNVKTDAADEYNDQLQAKLKNTVWTGCYSYYNLQGQKNIAMYPGTLWSFWRSLSKPIWDHYEVATSRESKKVD